MLKRLLRSLLIGCLLLGGAFYLLYRNQKLELITKLTDPWLNLTKASSQTQQLSSNLAKGAENLKTTTDKLTSTNIMTTFKHTLEAADQTKKFFQEVVKVDESKGENISDRTVKYATYLYCKQVVSEWEERN